VSFLTNEFDATQQAIQTGSFDPVGNNYTTFAGTTLQPPAPISGSNLFASGSGAPANPVTGSQGDPLAPLQGSTLSYSATPQLQGSIASATPSPASGPAAGSLADYFARTIIVILGFIFVAEGLHMLMPSVPSPTSVARV